MDIKLQRLIRNIQTVIVGEDENIEYIIIAMLSGGHVLLEGLPGVGKTKLALALSKSMNGIFKRVQFTPDVLPSDITGYYLYNRKTGEMDYRVGAVGCNLLLADEINRASPRVQSSLLEAMEERQVTVEGTTKKLLDPFIVIATQNTIENEGTYPLPEAQLDRFFMKLYMTYPKREEWKEILKQYNTDDPVKHLHSTITKEEFLELKNRARSVVVSDNLRDYLLDLLELISTHEAVQIGVNPRGSIALLKGAQAYALLQGRDYVLPNDIHKVIQPIIGHRIYLKSGYDNSNTTIQSIIQDALQKIKVVV